MFKGFDVGIESKIWASIMIWLSNQFLLFCFFFDETIASFIVRVHPGALKKPPRQILHTDTHSLKTSYTKLYNTKSQKVSGCHCHALCYRQFSSHLSSQKWHICGGTLQFSLFFLLCVMLFFFCFVFLIVLILWHFCRLFNQPKTVTIFVSFI